MPLATMASAWARTVRASIFSAKWFQLFQPIGGVGARFCSCAETCDGIAAQQINPKLRIKLANFPFISASVQSALCKEFRPQPFGGKSTGSAYPRGDTQTVRPV